jgi:hypothetical protein
MKNGFMNHPAYFAEIMMPFRKIIQKNLPVVETAGPQLMPPVTAQFIPASLYPEAYKMDS